MSYPQQGYYPPAQPGFPQPGYAPPAQPGYYPQPQPGYQPGYPPPGMPAQTVVVHDNRPQEDNFWKNCCLCTLCLALCCWCCDD